MKKCSGCKSIDVVFNKGQNYCQSCQKEHYLKNKEKVLTRSKIRDSKHAEEKKLQRDNYYKENRELVIRNQLKRYHNLDKDKLNLQKRIYEARRRKTDIQFRLQKALRSRLNKSLKSKTKVGSHVKDLGCSIEFLKQYLESQFKPGMTWSNWSNKPGCWSIDHIFPLSKADLTNRIELLKVCHYTNLQPLWHIEENIPKFNHVG